MVERIEDSPELWARAEQLFEKYSNENARKASRWFAWLMGIQWVAAILASFTWSPYTWAGRSASTHVHVYAAVFLGGAISSLPLFLAITRPTSALTRHVVSVAQVLWSALLIHLSGGRIETHFHVFVSLAFVAFYRDWRLLVTSGAVVAVDHFLRGIYWPDSVFGVSNPEWWRFLEHAFWVVFEVAVLIPACLRGVAETRLVATNQARAEERSVALEIAYEERDRSRREEQERLEGLVRERTAELRLVLDHVAEGLTTIDATGRLATERSKTLTGWFGEALPKDTLWEYLGRVDPRFGAQLALGFELLEADVLPLELAIDQLPRRLEHDGRTFELAVTPLDDTGKDGFLVVISDVTTAVEQTEAEAARRDLGAALDQILRDRTAFGEFISEASDIVARIARATEKTPELLRDLHTLKGNAGLMGFDGIATLCHQMETYVADTGDVPSTADRSQLSDRWRRIADTVGTITGSSENRVEVERRELAGLVSAIQRGEPKDKLVGRARALELEPAQRRLERLADQARSFATRLGKGGIAVEVGANEVRLDPAKWKHFWTAMVQVVRNAVTHGIETKDARRSSKKPETGRLDLATRLDPTQLVIEVRDDGGGVDWSAVKDAAAKNGLPTQDQSDLERALFALGVTTREEADEAAGRGVGLAAALTETEKLGGRIELETKPGQGTLFRFRFPRAKIGDCAMLPA